MRRKEQEITDKKSIEEILSSSLICRLGLAVDSVPYIVPVNYGYYKNALYIHSAPEGRKIELIKKNNKACFEIEDTVEILKNDVPCSWSTRYRSLIGYGSIEIIRDIKQKKHGLDIIMAQHGKKKNNIYMESQIEKMVILKLNIESVTGKQSK